MSSMDEKEHIKVKCGHCQNISPMKVLFTLNHVKDHEDETTLSWQEGRIWKLLVCPICAGVVLCNYYYHDGFSPESWPFQIVYPPKEKELNGLPCEIARAYQSAQRVKTIDSNAYAVLLGRVIELVCIDRGAKGEKLYNKLSYLAEKGEIPDKLADMAHQLRELRNIGAHADLGELTSFETPVLDDLCRAILEYVYTAPLLIKQVEKRIEILK